MAHIGIVCPAANGHLNPMTTLGHELSSRGHRVSLLSVPDAEEKAESSGIEFLSVGEKHYPMGTLKAEMEAIGRLAGFAAVRRTLNLFHKITEIILEELPKVVKENSCDFLLIDQSSFGGPEVAQHLGIPYISVACALLFNREPDVPPINTHWGYSPTTWGRFRNAAGFQTLELISRNLRRSIEAYQRRWNLPKVKIYDEMFSKLAQISQQPIEFEFPRKQLPECFHFTGPLANPNCRPESDFPFDKLDGRPLVYASLGTIQNQIFDAYHKIAEACENLDVQLVIALGGGSAPEQLGKPAGKPIVVGYAPQLQLLERAALTITHAGMNTTLESLKHGVPMVAIPITNDQPGVGARINWTETGKVLYFNQLSAKKLQQAVEEVLSNPAYKRHAKKMSEAIQRAGGTRRAADIVEQAVVSGQMVLS